jgi:hypothetical protein
MVFSRFYEEVIVNPPAVSVRFAPKASVLEVRFISKLDPTPIEP